MPRRPASHAPIAIARKVRLGPETERELREVMRAGEVESRSEGMRLSIHLAALLVRAHRSGRVRVERTGDVPVELALPLPGAAA